MTNPSVRNLELDLKNLATLTSLTGLSGLENLAIRRPVLDDALTQLAQLPALRAAYGLRAPKVGQVAAFELRPIDFVEGQFRHERSAR